MSEIKKDYDKTAVSYTGQGKSQKLWLPSQGQVSQHSKMDRGGFWHVIAAR